MTKKRKLKRRKYNRFYHVLTPEFREMVAKRKKRLAKKGIKFSYQQCFTDFSKFLSDKNKTAKELADERNIYKGKLVKNWIRNYLRDLEERLQ